MYIYTYRLVGKCSPQFASPLGHLCHFDAGVFCLNLLTVLVQPDHVAGQRTLWSFHVWLIGFLVKKMTKALLDPSKCVKISQPNKGFTWYSFKSIFVRFFLLAWLTFSKTAIYYNIYKNLLKINFFSAIKKYFVSIH